MMDQKLLDAILKNDTCTFLSLVEGNKGSLHQRTADSLNTVLHLASSYGHVEMVSEILRLCPEMVDAENKNHETSTHESCRKGNLKVLMLLLAANPKGFDQTCIHIAASRGHTDVVRELINKWADLAEATDNDGNSPLHHACNQGHREIAWMLLTHDPKLALQYNYNGYMPLHLAVMNGSVSILHDFLSTSLGSFLYLTREEDTVFHLAVRYGHYDALVFLVQFVSNGTKLLHYLDRYGNSVLHLAVAGEHHKIAEFLITKTELDINARNCQWITALDMLDKSKDSAEKRQLQATIIRAQAAIIRGGAKRSTLFLSPSPQVAVEEGGNEQQVSNNEMFSFDPITPPEVSRSTSGSRLSSPHPQAQAPERSLEKEKQKFDKLSPKALRKHKDLSTMQRVNLNQLYYARRNKNHEMQREALLNARNTIILVAILIATVTFAAGISPPGGVYQEGPLKGKSMVGKSTAFKVFAISNNIALFTSLSIVIVLVSVIPFTRKTHMRLLVVAHKAMWVAVAFMATGYVAAIWAILPHSEGFQWLSVALIAVGGGSLGTIFISLGVMLIKHWQRKSKWRKRRKESGEEDAVDSQRESQNSDVESSYLQGYHSY